MGAHVLPTLPSILPTISFPPPTLPFPPHHTSIPSSPPYHPLLSTRPSPLSHPTIPSFPPYHLLLPTLPSSPLHPTIPSSPPYHPLFPTLREGDTLPFLCARMCPVFLTSPFYDALQKLLDDFLYAQFFIHQIILVLGNLALESSMKHIFLSLNKAQLLKIKGLPSMQYHLISARMAIIKI